MRRKKAVSRPVDRIPAQIMMATIIAPVHMSFLKKYPAGIPKHTNSTASKTPKRKFGMVLDSVKSPTREAIIQITKLVAANAARSMPQNKYLLKTISRLIIGNAGR